MFDHLNEIICARDVRDIWLKHCRVMARFGFDRLFYGMTRARTGGNFGDPEDFVILSSYDKDYTDRFVNGGLFRHAPMARWAMSNIGACSWSWVVENDHLLTDREREVLAFNRQHGVRAGYTLSFPDLSARCKGIIALAAPASISQRQVDAIWARDGQAIWVANNVLHLKLSHLRHDTRRRLSPRQREVLEWIGDGKTSQDIALLLGVSLATVEKHLRLAREALGVQSTAQAVLKASLENQIFVLEGETRPGGLDAG